MTCRKRFANIIKFKTTYNEIIHVNNRGIEEFKWREKKLIDTIRSIRTTPPKDRPDRCAFLFSLKIVSQNWHTHRLATLQSYATASRATAYYRIRDSILPLTSVIRGIPRSKRRERERELGGTQGAGAAEFRLALQRGASAGGRGEGGASAPRKNHAGFASFSRLMSRLLLYRGVKGHTYICVCRTYNDDISVNRGFLFDRDCTGLLD